MDITIVDFRRIAGIGDDVLRAGEKGDGMAYLVQYHGVAWRGVGAWGGRDIT